MVSFNEAEHEVEPVDESAKSGFTRQAARQTQAVARICRALKSSTNFLSMN
jgi:hypothetical protein